MNCRFSSSERVWTRCLDATDPLGRYNGYPRSIPDNSGYQIYCVARSKACAWALSKLTARTRNAFVVCIFPDCTTTVVCGCVNRSQSKYICTHRRNAARRTLRLVMQSCASCLAQFRHSLCPALCAKCGNEFRDRTRLIDPVGVHTWNFNNLGANPNIDLGLGSPESRGLEKS